LSSAHSIRHRGEDEDAGLASAHLVPEGLPCAVPGDLRCVGPLGKDKQHVVEAVLAQPRGYPQHALPFVATREFCDLVDESTVQPLELRGGFLVSLFAFFLGRWSLVVHR
jgi:hypothetical protein